MKTRLSVTLSILIEDLIEKVLGNKDLDVDDFCTYADVNGSSIVISFQDLRDIRDCPEIGKCTKELINDFFRERGIKE